MGLIPTKSLKDNHVMAYRKITRYYTVKFLGSSLNLLTVANNNNEAVRNTVAYLGDLNWSDVWNLTKGFPIVGRVNKCSVPANELAQLSRKQVLDRNPTIFR